jgi:hypothetical protein
VKLICKTVFILNVLLTNQALAGSAFSLTYQGRILKPDGSTPFEGAATFRFEVKSDLNACVLWREDVLINLAGTQGGMAMQIGLGTNLATGSHSFVDVFDNTKTLTSLSGCSVGTSFAPAYNEDRTLSVSFNDGSSTQILPNIAVKSVPFSLYSERSRYATTSLGLGSTSISLTAPTPGQVLQYNGGTQLWEPANVGGAGTVTNVGLIGSSLFSVSGGSVSSSGTFSLGMASVGTGNFILASPNGAPGVPTFRAMTAGDVPTLPAS